MNDKSQLVGQFVSVPTSPEQLWRWRGSSKPLLSSQKINKGQVEGHAPNLVIPWAD